MMLRTVIRVEDEARKTMFRRLNLRLQGVHCTCDTGTSSREHVDPGTSSGTRHACRVHGPTILDYHRVRHVISGGAGND
jgi:hypothetical protein